MPKYLIERKIPDAGKMTGDQWQAAAENSCNVLRRLGPEVQWLESYVTQDKVFCVYIAESEELVREHAKQAGLPVESVSEVKRIIDPTTAEERVAS